MYWQLRMQPPSTIDSLLSSDDCSLEAVLDEEYVLDELKTNRNLLEFLCEENNLQKIVALLVEEPSSDLPECSRYRRSQTAADLFGLELNSSTPDLVEVVADSESLLDRLWLILDQEAPLNSLVASFFSRTMHNILQRRAEKVMIYVRQREGLLDKILKHLDTSAIMALLVSFLLCCDTFHLRFELAEWFNDNNLVKKLVNLVRADRDTDIQRNASHTLGEMVRICYEQATRASTSPPSNPVLEMLEAEQTVDLLLANITEAKVANTTLLCGTTFLQSLLAAQLGQTESDDSTPVSSNKEAARCVTACITSWLPSLHEVLTSQPESKPIVTSAATVAVPLGAARLSLIQLLMMCLETKVACFTHEFVRLDIPATILNLFLEYCWNSFLHTQFERLVNTAFPGNISESATLTSEPEMCLARCLLVENHLIGRLATAGLDNEREQNAPGGRRRGYMGHIVSISNTILSCVAKNSCVSGLVAGLDEEESKTWRSWVNTALHQANEKNSIVLGGQDVKEEEETPPEETLPALDDVQQAFITYQLSQLTTELDESFGFCDELISSSDAPFAAPLNEVTDIDFDLKAPLPIPMPDHFRMCCEARIQPFNEPTAEELSSSPSS